MSFVSGANSWLSVILKILAITLAVIAISYLGLSVIGNIWQPRTATLPEMPVVAKAPYQFTLKTTGQIVLAKSYVTISVGSYLLDGYYSLVKNKWRWSDSTLPLDEKYFGVIEIKQR